MLYLPMMIILILFEVSWSFNGEVLENENSLTLGVLNAGIYEFTLTSNESGRL